MDWSKFKGKVVEKITAMPFDELIVIYFEDGSKLSIWTSELEPHYERAKSGKKRRGEATA